MPLSWPIVPTQAFPSHCCHAPRTGGSWGPLALRWKKAIQSSPPVTIQTKHLASFCPKSDCFSKAPSVYWELSGPLLGIRSSRPVMFPSSWVVWRYKPERPEGRIVPDSWSFHSLHPSIPRTAGHKLCLFLIVVYCCCFNVNLFPTFKNRGILFKNPDFWFLF